MKEITVKIDKETLKASIDMEGYIGNECLSDYEEIIRAMETTPELVIDKGRVSVDGKITIKS